MVSLASCLAWLRSWVCRLACRLPSSKDKSPVLATRKMAIAIIISTRVKPRDDLFSRIVCIAPLRLTEMNGSLLAEAQVSSPWSARLTYRPLPMMM